MITPILTISNELCTDTMIYDILNDEKFLNSNTTDGIGGNSLNSNDKILLEEYAPKLFNTLEKFDDLQSVMTKLVDLVNIYRYKSIIHRGEKKMLTLYPKIKSASKKTEAEKIKIFKNHIVNMIKLAGDNRYSLQDHQKSKEYIYFWNILDDVCDHPEDYFPAEYRDVSTPQKETIEKYLMGLKLPGKTESIKEFMKKIC